MPSAGESLVILGILSPFVIGLIAIRWYRKKHGL